MIPESFNSELLFRFGVQCIDPEKWSLHQKESFKIFLDLPRVLGKNVEANDCVVHGEALRNGHRARRLDSKGILKTLLRASNRKEALIGRPVHPDAKVACDNI